MVEALVAARRTTCGWHRAVIIGPEDFDLLEAALSISYYPQPSHRVRADFRHDTATLFAYRRDGFRFFLILSVLPDNSDAMSSACGS